MLQRRREWGYAYVVPHLGSGLGRLVLLPRREWGSYVVHAYAVPRLIPGLAHAENVERIGFAHANSLIASVVQKVDSLF